MESPSLTSQNLRSSTSPTLYRDTEQSTVSMKGAGNASSARGALVDRSPLTSQTIQPIQAIVAKAHQLLGSAKQTIADQLISQNIKPSTLTMVVANQIGQQDSLAPRTFKFITDSQLLPGQLLTLLVRGSNSEMSVAHFLTQETTNKAKAQELTRMLLPLKLPRTELLGLLTELLGPSGPSSRPNDHSQAALKAIAYQHLSRVSAQSKWINKLNVNWQKSLTSSISTQSITSKASPQQTSLPSTQKLRQLDHRLVNSLLNENAQRTVTSKALPNNLLDQLLNDIQRTEFQLLRDTLKSTDLSFVSKVTQRDPSFIALIKWLNTSSGSLTNSKPINDPATQSSHPNQQAEWLSKIHRLLMTEWQSYRSANSLLLTTQNTQKNIAWDQLISQVFRLKQNPINYAQNSASAMDNIKALMIRASLGSLAQSYLNSLQPSLNTSDDYQHRLLFCQLPIFIPPQIEQVTLAIDKKKNSRRSKKEPLMGWLIHLGFSLAHAGKIYVELFVDERLHAKIHIWANQADTLKWIKSHESPLNAVYSRQGINVSDIFFHLGERDVPVYASKTTQLNIKT